MSPKYQVRLLSIAEDDLTNILAYAADENPAAAHAMYNRFESCFDLLAENSHLGRMPREEELAKLGYRYLVVGNYLVFYVIEKQTIFVHRIIHGARNYVELLA